LFCERFTVWAEIGSNISKNDGAFHNNNFIIQKKTPISRLAFFVIFLFVSFRPKEEIAFVAQVM